MNDSNIPVVPDQEMISKCCYKAQLIEWLNEARLDLDAIRKELDEATANGKTQRRREDRRFIERMYKLKREKGHLIHLLNERLCKLRNEPAISFEEFLLEQLRVKLSLKTFSRILGDARQKYRNEVLGLKEE